MRLTNYLGGRKIYILQAASSKILLHKLYFAYLRKLKYNIYPEKNIQYQNKPHPIINPSPTNVPIGVELYVAAVAKWGDRMASILPSPQPIGCKWPNALSSMRLAYFLENYLGNEFIISCENN